MNDDMCMLQFCPSESRLRYIQMLPSPLLLAGQKSISQFSHYVLNREVGQ